MTNLKLIAAFAAGATLFLPAAMATAQSQQPESMPTQSVMPEGQMQTAEPQTAPMRDARTAKSKAAKPERNPDGTLKMPPPAMTPEPLQQSDTPVSPPPPQPQR